jgi:hypothetical protein
VAFAPRTGVLEEPTDARLRMVARQGSADDARTCVIVASGMKGTAHSSRVLWRPMDMRCRKQDNRDARDDRWICRRSCNAGCISNLHVKA